MTQAQLHFILVSSEKLSSPTFIHLTQAIGNIGGQTLFTRGRVNPAGLEIMIQTWVSIQKTCLRISISAAIYWFPIISLLSVFRHSRRMTVPTFNFIMIYLTVKPSVKLCQPRTATAGLVQSCPKPRALFHKPKDPSLRFSIYLTIHGFLVGNMLKNWVSITILGSPAYPEVRSWSQVNDLRADYIYKKKNFMERRNNREKWNYVSTFL